MQIPRLCHLGRACLTSLALLPCFCLTAGILVAQEDEKPRPNIIKNLIEGFFGPAAPATPRQDPTGSTARDRLDARAASDVERTRRVDQLRTLIRDKRWDDSIDLIEYLLATEQDHLLRLPNGTWVSLLGEVERIVTNLPEEGLRNYRNRFEGTAGQRRKAALESGDFSQLVSVANQFAATSAGFQAAEDVAAILQDQGRYATAARWYDRMELTNPSGTESNQWKWNAARAFLLSGNRSRAEAILKGVTALPPLDQAVTAKTNDAASQWLDSIDLPATLPVDIHGETRQPGGSPAHAGVYHAEAPLLFAAWRQPLVQRYAVDEQLDSIRIDLGELHKATLPSLFPVATGDKVAVRTLSGLAVFNAASGREQWHMDFEAAPERLLAGTTLRRGRTRPAIQSVSSQPYDGNNPEQHPLTGVAYRDGVYGSLSSDGRRVFVLEDIAVMPQNVYGYWQQEDTVDPLGRDWSSNSLSAYDLESGRRLWRIGGRKIEEQFSPVLAGTFFFGAPVVDGQELFIIGESSETMSLFCLRADTGELLWSQPISGVGQSISRDMVRRGWACFPAVSQGVIVCPTTAGWLVAIDRLQRRFLWTHRYMARSNSNQGRTGYLINQPLDLHARWASGPPVILDNTVVYAPPELPDETGNQQPVLIGLDLATGKPKWPAIAKGESLALIGASHGRIYTMGVRSLSCFGALDGKMKWTTNWSDADDLPSGRAILTETSVLQPLQSGILLELDRESGQVRRTQKLPPDELPLGNLIVGNGRVLSVGPQEIVCWEPDQPLAQLEKEAKESVEAAVRLAELHLRLQRPEDAATVAQAIELPPDATPPQRQARRDVLWKSLWALAKSDLKSNTVTAAELKSVAASEANEEDIVRLEADRAYAQGRFIQAWKAYLSLAEMGSSEWIEESSTSVRRQSWIAGRLEMSYAKLGPEDRKIADLDVANRLRDLKPTSSEGDRCRLFRFHSLSVPHRFSMVEDNIRNKEYTSAAIELERLAQHPDLVTRATATWELARLLRSQGWIADARAKLEGLLSAHPDIVIPAGKVADIVPTVIAELPPSNEQTEAGWTGKYEVARVFREQSPQPRTNAVFGNLPRFLDDKRVQVIPQTQRFNLIRQDGTVLWSIPLRSAASELFAQESPVFVRGPLAYVVHNGVVHSLSLLESQSRWAHVPDLKSGGRNLFRQPQVAQRQPMMRANQFAQPRLLSRTFFPTGILGTASEFVVVIHEKRSIIAIDSLTGEKLWERKSVRPNTMTYTDGANIYLYSNAEASLVLDAMTGRERMRIDEAHPFEKAKRIIPGGVILAELKQTDTQKKVNLSKMESPAGDGTLGPVVWERQISSEALVTFLDDSTIFIVAPDGNCESVDLHTGKVTELANISSQFADMETFRRRSSLPIYCLVDGRRLFLLVDQQAIQQYTYLPLPNIRCAGLCIAMSRTAPKVFWKETVAGYNMPTDRISELPVLPFIVIKNVNDNKLQYQQIKIRLLDKSSGRPVIDWEGKSYQSHFYTMTTDPTHKSLEFRSYNETFWVRPVPPDMPEPMLSAPDASTPAVPQP